MQWPTSDQLRFESRLNAALAFGLSAFIVPSGAVRAAPPGPIHCWAAWPNGASEVAAAVAGGRPGSTTTRYLLKALAEVGGRPLPQPVG